MSAEHIDGVEALEKACFSAPWARVDIERQLTNGNARFLVAESGGEVCAYIGIFEICEMCEVANLAVKSDFRRMGIASALLEAACAGAAERGREFITLEVRQSNAPARALYEKLGFSMEGRRKNFYSSPVEDGIIMTKSLVK